MCKEKSIVELLGITPGPWEWCVNRSNRHVALFGSSIGFGKECVMDFVRYGMNSAQPRFREGHILVKSSERAIPRADDEHNAGWRADIDAVDSRVIAAAPEMLDALIEYCIYIETGDCEPDEKWISIIEKATGKSWEDIQCLKK